MTTPPLKRQWKMLFRWNHRPERRGLRKRVSSQNATPGIKWPEKQSRFMKVALIYDRINKWGGAERVLLALHEVFPKADLFTAVYSPSKAKWAKVFPKVIPSFLQKIPFANSNPQFLGTLTPLAFETF